MATKLINARVSASDVAELDRLSKREKCSRSQLVAKAIRAYIRSRRLKSMCRWLEKNQARDRELAEELMVLDDDLE